MSDAVRAAIVRAAQEQGFDPALALAIAERESDLDPNARASKTIFGVFQMNRGERYKYGAGDSTDPYVQARSWIAYARDLQAEMAQHLGRAPTSAELYHGHYFGGGRAARMATGAIDPQTPVSEIFTPRELAENPNIVRAGTAGALTSSVTGDINRRISRYGGDPGTAMAANRPRYSEFGETAVAVPYSSFGELADAGPGQKAGTGAVAFWGPGDTGWVQEGPTAEWTGEGAPTQAGPLPERYAQMPKSKNIEDRRGQSPSLIERATGFDTNELSEQFRHPMTPINDRRKQPLPPPPSPGDPNYGAADAAGLNDIGMGSYDAEKPTLPPWPQQR